MTAELSLAIHGLVYLWKKDTVVTSSELAESICTNPARVRKVMAKLKHSGLVESTEGKGSGYHTISDACNIRLCQVLSALGEDVISEGWKSAQLNSDCMISSGMTVVMDNLCVEMNLLCRDYLKDITIEMVAASVFEKTYNGKEDRFGV
ncbi:MAG TPA: Rrf2 family transcriptional regulator [Lachnospiraceae bacterium]|nr:Rrf2 family transcriptional regulator [Lachnospiraceae bacterium]